VFGLAGAADSSLADSVGAMTSRSFRRIGSGTSKRGLRSNFRDSKLSAIIFAYSRSNSASASGSNSSSCRVTTMVSSSSESDPGAEANASPLVVAYRFC
jgi:hypothetical protein